MDTSDKNGNPQFDTWLDGRDPNHQPVPGGPTLRDIYGATYPTDGGFAFPTLLKEGELAYSTGGLTVRDYFAAKAMQAFMTGCESFDEAVLVAAAFRMADLMIKARAE